MRRVRLLFLPLILLCFGINSPAQTWSGIIDPSRATDWSTAGVEGGIPSGSWPNCTTAACNTLFGGTVTGASIDAALASAPVNTVVRIPAGNFTLSAGINFTKSNVALRGAGASQTKLVMNGTLSSCGLFFSEAVRMCSGINYGTTGGGGSGPNNSATWTAGYSQGTTVITLGGTTNLTVGSTIFLDQLDDASDGWPDAGDIWQCSSAPACSSEGGNSWARVGRVHVEMHKVVAINGSNITISPGVMSPDYRSGKSPGAWWANAGNVLQNSGIEDLTVDFTGGGGMAILMANNTNTWVTRTRMIYNGGPGSFVNHVTIINGLHTSVTSNYFYGPTVVGNTQYAYTVQLGSLNLLENNIFHHNVGPVAANDPEVGSVYGYNYFNDAFYAGGPQVHNAGDLLNLWEGNDAATYGVDNIHGTHHFLTWYRNIADGHENNRGGVAYDGAVFLLARNRFHNFIGNVWGSSAFTIYNADQTCCSGVNNSNVVYSTGWKESATANDPRVLTTMMRWWNWDSLTSTNDTGTNDQTGTRCVSGEVPSGLTNFPNSVPASCGTSYPASFYLSSKPAWFGSVPWPPIGPDVTNGNKPNTSSFPTGGHANKIPARVCFEGAANDPTYASSSPRIKLIDAANCYAGGDPPPDPPTGLAAVAK